MHFSLLRGFRALFLSVFVVFGLMVSLSPPAHAEELSVACGDPYEGGPECTEDVGLPYNYTVTYISGGSGGVRTPSFYTNSTGKICVSANFKVRTNKQNGDTPDRRYRVELYREDTFGDERVRDITWYAGVTSYSYNKTCWTGLADNSDYHVRFKKTVYDSGTLKGYGTVSYT